ncbi:MAG: alpha/beta hydrolase [Flavobacteriaceae bacterium]|nr:alpha/beta hydrolase [Flavobacteriaceae bacterium]
MKKIIIYTALYFLFLTSSFAQVISKEVFIKNDSIELPGTLSYINTTSPLVIWIHGSGNIDRNGNQAGVNIKANYIQQFREKMNNNGFAFFSYDKRTANPKNFKLLKNTLFDDLVDDAKIIVKHLKDNYTFKEIVLIGHSQGSLTAMLASENANKYISLAGLSNSFDKTLVKQVTNQNAMLGKVADEHFKELFKTGTIKQVNPFLVSIFRKQNYPFLINWAKYNPSKEIQKLNIPILIVNGDKDIQVKIEDAKAMHKAKPSSRLAIIENMNHVLKHIEKDADNMNSYYTADFPISTKLITTILNFIRK